MMTTPLVCLLLTPRSRLRADRIVVSIASWVPLNRSRPPATTSSLLLSMRAVGRRSRSLTMVFRRRRVSASWTRLDCGNFRRAAPSSKNSFNYTRRSMITSIEWTPQSPVGARRGCVSAMSVRVSSAWHQIADIVSSTPGWISETSWKLESDSRWKDLQCQSLKNILVDLGCDVQTARQKDGKIEVLMQHVQRADGCIESRINPPCAHAQPLKAVRSQEVTGSGPRETTSSMEDMCMQPGWPCALVHQAVRKVQQRWHLHRKFRLHQQYGVQDPHMGAWDQNHQAADVAYCGSGALQDDHQQSPHWYSWHQIIVVESDKEAEESSTDDDMPNLEAAVVTIARKQNRSVKRTKIVLSFTCHGMGFCTTTLDKFAAFIYHWGPVRFERITFDWFTNLVFCDLRVVNEQLVNPLSAGSACVPWESCQDTHVCCWLQDDPAADRELVCSCVTLVVSSKCTLTQMWVHPLRPNRPVIIGLRSTRYTV